MNAKCDIIKMSRRMDQFMSMELNGATLTHLLSTDDILLSG